MHHCGVARVVSPVAHDLARERGIAVEVCAYWPTGDGEIQRDTPLRKVDPVDIACRLGGTAGEWVELLGK